MSFFSYLNVRGAQMTKTCHVPMTVLVDVRDEEVVEGVLIARTDSYISVRDEETRRTVTIPMHKVAGVTELQ